jgi:hypothetical protein
MPESASCLAWLAASSACTLVKKAPSAHDSNACVYKNKKKKEKEKKRKRKREKGMRLKPRQIDPPSAQDSNARDSSPGGGEKKQWRRHKERNEMEGSLNPLAQTL